jgi:hypothetical protein
VARPGLRSLYAVLPAAWLLGMAAIATDADADPVSTVQTVVFPGHAPIKVVRGSAERPPASPTSLEIVTFATPTAGSVRVLRGAGGAAVGSAEGRRIETVSFGNIQMPPVTVVRGAASLPREPVFDLFAAALGGDLDRVAFAVDGVESSHGTNPLMWRDSPSGPQGPMQVSEAAAIDVGGGNRFDIRENRLLGRAYLARMYARYGNWLDAIAAYNWGPGNLDVWIAAGRPRALLPFDVERYVERVLRDALADAMPLRDTTPRPRQGI